MSYKFNQLYCETELGHDFKSGVCVHCGKTAGEDSPDHTYIICPNCEMPYNQTLDRCSYCEFVV